jgi:RNA polymerase sigma-70 factor (ECF subfamily)
MNAHTAIRDASAPAPAPEVDEAVLIARAQAGDHAAFDRLYERYHTPILNYLYRLMGSSEDAYDLTQDTFLKAYLALERTSDDLRVGAWLYRIATNVALDELRHRKLIKWQSWDAFVSVFHPSQVAAAKDQPERLAVDREDTEEVQAILEKLHPKYRVCLVLREYRDLSYDEIAEALVTTRAAVKSLLFRAREEFRQVYARIERQPGRAARGVPAVPRTRPGGGPKTWGVQYRGRHNPRKPWRAEPYDRTAPRRSVHLGDYATAAEAQAAVAAWQAGRAGRAERAERAERAVA